MTQLKTENAVMNDLQYITDAVRACKPTQHTIAGNTTGLLFAVPLGGDLVKVFVPDGQNISEQRLIYLVCLEKNYIDSKKERFAEIFNEISQYVVKSDVKVSFERVGERMAMKLSGSNVDDRSGFEISAIVKDETTMVTSGAAAALNVLKRNFPNV